MDDTGGGGRLAYGGIDLLWLILGFIGAALGIGSMPPMSKRALATALGAGVVCAALAPQAAAELFALWKDRPAVMLPVAVNNVLAFLFGIGGMFIVPGLSALWRRIVENPVGFLRWARGGFRGNAPPKPDDAAGEGKP